MFSVYFMILSTRRQASDPKVPELCLSFAQGDRSSDSSGRSLPTRQSTEHLRNFTLTLHGSGPRILGSILTSRFLSATGVGHLIAVASSTFLYSTRLCTLVSPFLPCVGRF